MLKRLPKPWLRRSSSPQSSVDVLSPRYLQQEHADDEYGGVLVHAGSPRRCARRFVFLLIYIWKYVILKFNADGNKRSKWFNCIEDYKTKVNVYFHYIKTLMSVLSRQLDCLLGEDGLRSSPQISGILRALVYSGPGQGKHNHCYTLFALESYKSDQSKYQYYIDYLLLHNLWFTDFQAVDNKADFQSELAGLALDRWLLSNTAEQGHLRDTNPEDHQLYLQPREV